MKKRKLGNTQFQVAPITFGGNVFGWTIDEKKSFEILDAFVGEGFNFIDTADSYSWWVDGNKGGESEAIIGNWLKSRKKREHIIISTKTGSQTKEHPENISKEHILRNVDESLKRLNTDYIDLYQTHFDDHKTPVEETLSAYETLLKAGKIRAIGVSNMSPERIKASMEAAERDGLPKYQTLQPLYNLVEREAYEKELRDLAQHYNFGVISYYSLASGFLTGKYQNQNDLDKSVRGQGVKKYMNDHDFSIVKKLREIAGKYNSSPATVSLAWLLNRPTITAPIVSATSRDQLKSITAAPYLNLDTWDINELNRVSSWK